MIRGLQPLDLGAYVRALGLYARNPALALPPFITTLLGTLLILASPPTGGPVGGLAGGFTGLIVSLLDSFGLAVSLIIADYAWRRGRAPVDVAFAEAKRKAGDILLAAIGFNFLLFVAGLVGSFLGNTGAIVVTAVAAYFFIYTIPAAAIGGIPGGAALQVSIERVQRSYVNTFFLGIVFVLFTALFPTVWGYAATALAGASDVFASNSVVQIVGACIKALGIGYLALVMAKAYNDASYGRFS
ncbi:MAG: hypothetical protein JO060_00530 [Candidatus Eremiobacteraeota bacterium]|nr:hypothetical protein [Candidatus Eremiobacteraeota bacterium]